MKLIHAAPVALLAFLGSATATEPTLVLDYEVVAVKRRLVLESPTGDRQLAAGDQVRSGDVLFTARRSSAELAVSSQNALFKISTRTRFRLAHDRPGVLLDLERGGVRGIFGPLLGGDDRERLLTTPSAVLAVRGTDYGVEVDRNGATTLTVFEGIVEVRDPEGVAGAVPVGAGQVLRVRRGEPFGEPGPHELRGDDWDRGRRVREPAFDHGGAGAPGMEPPGPGGATAGPSPRGGSKRHGG